MKTLISAIAVCIFIYYFSSCSNNSVSPTTTNTPTHADSIVKLAAPVNGTSFPDSANITFSWHKTLNASVYKLEVGTDSLFTQNPQFYIVNDTSYSDLRQCGGGCINYWRVAISSNQVYVWSDTWHWSQH